MHMKLSAIATQHSPDNTTPTQYALYTCMHCKINRETKKLAITEVNVEEPFKKHVKPARVLGLWIRN